MCIGESETQRKVIKGRKTMRSLGSRDYSSVCGESKERKEDQKRNRAVQYKQGCRVKYIARQTENGPLLPRYNSNLQAYMDEPKDR